MASTSRSKRERVKNAENQPITRLLPSPDLQQRYSEHFENRKVLGSKFLAWDYFTGLGIKFIDLLQNLRIIEFIRYKGAWSPEVIRAFYCSFKYRSRDRVFTAEIRGTKILVDEAIC